jgi:hypothetical protein
LSPIRRIRSPTPPGAARIAGVPIGKLIEARGESLDGVRKKIEDSVRYANITVIEGNDASQFAAHRQRWSTQAFGCSPRSCARDG